MAAFVPGSHLQVTVGTGERQHSQGIKLNGRELHGSHAAVTATASPFVGSFYSSVRNPAMMETSVFCQEPASTLLTLKQSIDT